MSQKVASGSASKCRFWRRKPWLAAALLAGAAGASGVFASTVARVSEPEVVAYWDGPVARLEENGVLYAYDTRTGAETLHDLRADPKAARDLAPCRPEVVARLRSRLQRALHASSLDDLREQRRAMIERLESLGYF